MKRYVTGMLAIALQIGALQEVAAQAPLRAELYERLRPASSDFASTLHIVALQAPRRSPGLVRFAGGFVTAMFTVGAVIKWSESPPAPLLYGALAGGSAVGAAVATRLWERPNAGIWIGAAVGALPMLIPGFDDEGFNSSDGEAFFTLAFFGAPLGAAIGQSAGRRER